MKSTIDIIKEYFDFNQDGFSPNDRLLSEMQTKEAYKPKWINNDEGKKMMLDLSEDEKMYLEYAVSLFYFSDKCDKLLEQDRELVWRLRSKIMKLINEGKTK